MIKFMNRVMSYLTSKKARTDLDDALEIAAKCGPTLDIAATIVTTLTPNQVDDVVWRLIRQRYPSLFDGSMARASAEERKLMMLGVAGEIVEAKYPGVGTTVARQAVQLAYMGRKGQE
jgi:hypothetical protein